MPGGQRPRALAAPPIIVMAIGATVAIVGSAMPWVRTGARSRNSYDVFELVERLGFSAGGLEAAALRWWPVIPVLVIAPVVVAAWGAGRAGGVLGVVGGGYVGAVGTAVAAARPGSGIEIGPGAVVAAIGGWVLLGGSVFELVASVVARRDG
jgi:hypothetical protein